MRQVQVVASCNMYVAPSKPAGITPKTRCSTVQMNAPHGWSHVRASCQHSAVPCIKVTHWKARTAHLVVEFSGMSCKHVTPKAEIEIQGDERYAPATTVDTTRAFTRVGLGAEIGVGLGCL